ncbi:ABC transporter ATP-binding protein [bacterium]|nr:ABC transporter ATP-binding protein [bacterium]
MSDITIRLLGASRWYGEILGINKINVDIPSGITGLVGPNGSGKSTLMNLICGLMQPDQGRVLVHGEDPWNNAELHRKIGYCTQSDKFFENFTGRQFMESMLRMHGRGEAWARHVAAEALDRLTLTDAANRCIRTYSKGMRQRVKVALALAHEPDVLILDEPFNGLDPVGRRELIRMFVEYGREGRTVLVSSHVLHEIEQMTDRILMMSNGYVMAEGAVREVRDQLRSHPFRVLVRCNAPRRLAARLLQEPHVHGAELDDDRSVTVVTNDPDSLYLKLNDVVLEEKLEPDLVTLADENVSSIFKYLAGREHH